MGNTEGCIAFTRQPALAVQSVEGPKQTEGQVSIKAAASLAALQQQHAVDDGSSRCDSHTMMVQEGLHVTSSGSADAKKSVGQWCVNGMQGAKLNRASGESTCHEEYMEEDQVSAWDGGGPSECMELT